MDSFFNDISLPTLNINEKETLETLVLVTEVKSAIKTLSSGKSPSDGGYSIEFYKSFQDILAPMSMRSAGISLIPKPGKDHTQMSNFCPLSLLNNDYKDPCDAPGEGNPLFSTFGPGGLYTRSPCL